MNMRPGAIRQNMEHSGVIWQYFAYVFNIIYNAKVKQIMLRQKVENGPANQGK